MQDKEEMTSLVTVEKKLNGQGYTSDFTVKDGRLTTMSDHDNAPVYTPEETTIVDYFRFEGESNPDDAAILYAIETTDGTKGTISSAYGVYANEDVDQFILKVESLGKNLMKGTKRSQIQTDLTDCADTSTLLSYVV
ncbi:MAG: hypothetical protein WKG07_23525 [Hymenobacter sp.]